MDSKKIFVIVLVILAVLYLASLGAGIAFNRQNEVNIERLQRRAEGRTGALFEFFAERLELRTLECNGKKVADRFTLDFSGNDTDTCMLALSPKLEDDDDFRKTELRFAPLPVNPSGGPDKPPTVYLAAGYIEENFPKADRDEGKCFLTSEPPEAFRLEVTYTPSDDPATDWGCWLQRDLPLKITVTKGGGTLKLELVCDDCGDRNHRRALLRMK